MKRILNTMACVFLLCAATQAADKAVAPDDRFADSIVRIMATYQIYNPVLPWQKYNPRIQVGYGVVVDDTHVLTLETIVRNCTQVELSKPRSGDKFTASVKQSDIDANLAILTIDDPEAMAPLKPLEIASVVPTDAELTLVQFDATRNIEQDQGKIVQALVTQMPGSESAALSFRVFSDLDVRGNKAIAMYGNKVAGFVMGSDNESRIATVLAAPVIGRFMEDVQRTPYPGRAFAGVAWQSLANPAMREYLGVTDRNSGVVVSSATKGTGADGVLKAEDVITEWDGCAVDSLGYYNDPDYGRILFTHLIHGKRRPGEKVPVKIIRGGKPMEVSVELVRYSESRQLVPMNRTGERAEYIVSGGLVLRELSADYLAAKGEGDMSRSDPRLIHLLWSPASKPEKPGDRIVLLANVLPDPVNVGYQHLNDQVVTRVNGEEVRNIGDVFRIVDRDGGITGLSLKGLDLDIALDKSMLNEADVRIAREYQIPRLRYRKPSAE